MPSKRQLIIGCSAAGLSALETIRSLAPDDEIRMVTREDTLPYSPAALPYLTSGRMSEDKFWIKNREYFSRMKVSLSQGKEVVQVVPEEKKVVYSGGDWEAFDNLLIGVGAEPVNLPIKGLEENSIFHFHTFWDFKRLAQRLGNTNEKNVLIYGGGLVAVELAMSLLERGNPVAVVVRSRLLRGYFNEYVGGVIENILRDKGAEIYTGNEITEGKKQKDKIGVTLSDGSSLLCDIFVGSVGVRPRTSMVAGTQIRTNVGILADRRMETTVPGIYTAGDVAEAPGFFSGKQGINPILPNALRQGTIAGANMAGKTTEYEGWVSLNILNLHGNVACSIGEALPSEGGYEVLEEESDRGKRFKRLVFKENRLHGAMFLNADVDPGAARYLIENKVDIGSYKEALLEKTVELCSWLVSRTEKEKSKVS
ncbi:MAG: FAD-dependent oxidoreductase [Deltaproteobacteria bacterium]|nr:FAD-dependent oxidoreductase [Deltaproteobacteria bacterium]